MKFIQKCNELIKTYEEDCVLRKNGTILLKPGRIPVARHMLHAGLERAIMEEQLINLYRNKIPEEYLELIRNFNGMTLYTLKINYGKSFEFAQPLFSIFAIPLTPSNLRAEYGEEPIDIRMMDLERHKDIPSKWLKIGNYMKSVQGDIFYDIFVDTETNRAVVCKRMECFVEQEWDSLDECLCDIFDLLSSTEWDVTLEAQ